MTAARHRFFKRTNWTPSWITMEDFVRHYVEHEEKRRPITKILIAANGYEVIHFIQSVRHELTRNFNSTSVVKFLWLTAPQHRFADYMKMADIKLITPDEDDLCDPGAILAHAIVHDVDAVWAGAGEVAHNPELPRILSEKRIVFLGPPNMAMFYLGNPISMTIIAQTLKIPTLPWSGSGLVVKEGMFANDIEEVLANACVSTINEGLEAVVKHKIGFPLQINAIEGGKGRGFRKAHDEDEFKHNFLELKTVFPSASIYIVKDLDKARHIEVQLLADRYENIIPVYSRECTVERNGRKIVAEAPACVAPSLLMMMQNQAMTIADFLRYEGFGTVEYLYAQEENMYFFQNMKPYTEMEDHGTELISNLPIPWVQIQIAMGLPLSCISAIRQFYGFKGNDAHDTTPLAPNLIKILVKKHCFALRITSDDAESTIGTAEKLTFTSSEEVNGYMFHPVARTTDAHGGHMFAVGENREDAILKIRGALIELKTQHRFAKSLSYLEEILADSNFTHCNDNKGSRTRVECNNLNTGDMQKEESVSHVEAQGGDHSMKRAESRKRDHEHETAEEPQEKK